MATIIEQKESHINRKQKSYDHIQRLIDALGNPSEWEYKGECIDAGDKPAKCSCGHKIRWIFILHHPDGRTANIGSVCVEQYASIRPEDGEKMRQDLEILKESIKQDKKKAKEAQQQEKVRDLEATFNELRATLDTKQEELYQTKYREGYALNEDESRVWNMRWNAPRKAKPYKTASGYLKFYEHWNQMITNALNAMEEKVKT